MKKEASILCGMFLLIPCGIKAKAEGYQAELVGASHYVGAGKESKKPMGHSDIDLGKIEFFFKASERPIVSWIPASPGKEGSRGLKTNAYLFPRSTIAHKQVKKMIAKLNQLKNPHYTLKVQQVKVPKEGVMLTITYDPKQLFVDEYHVYPRMNKPGQWGVDFRFYNQALMDLIKLRVNESRRIASLKKKESLLIAGMGERILGPLVVLA